MKRLQALAAMVLLLTAFGLMAAHLHTPYETQPRCMERRAAAQRQAERMPRPVPDGAVNVNTAAADELDALPGIGPVLAGRILRERAENGRFYYPQDLLGVYGIGPKTLQKLLDRICLP